MRTAFLSGLILISGLALLGGCSSDSPSPVTTCVDSCAENQEIAEFVVTNNCYWLPSDQNILNQNYLIYIDGKVTDTKGNEIGTFDSATGTMTLNDGTTVENIDLSTLTELTPEKVEQAKEEVQSAASTQSSPSSEGSSAGGSGNDNNSSSSESQGTNNNETNTSSSTEESSSSFGKVQGGVADPTGYPVASYNNLLVSHGSGNGWNSRYWDACKPHCAWSEKVDANANPYQIARNCSIQDEEIPAFTKSEDGTWLKGTVSACDNGGFAFACTDMIPVAVNDTLAYAFVAGPPTQGCGKCYHFQYDGHFHNEGDYNKPKETHKALAGKHIIAMASNIGHDVDGGTTQFDLMVPGGGVGAFDALSRQTGFDMRNGIEGYGGFLTNCQREIGTDASLEAYQSCVKGYCSRAFSSIPNLLQGCNWFADWFMAADNPNFYWEEVECPQYLVDKYVSTINTSPRLADAPNYQNF
ncbi:MAG: glycosyl hydrolase family 5 [Fibrobacter sp.]|nr:glycosyl hydrolase family 5 [Fibrobacter sp.]